MRADRPARGDPLTTFKVTGMYEAAMHGGADEVINRDRDDYAGVKVPNVWCFGGVKLPRSLVGSDVIVNVPRMKTNLYMHSPVEMIDRRELENLYTRLAAIIDARNEEIPVLR